MSKNLMNLFRAQFVEKDIEYTEFNRLNTLVQYYTDHAEEYAKGKKEIHLFLGEKGVAFEIVAWAELFEPWRSSSIRYQMVTWHFKVYNYADITCGEPPEMGSLYTSFPIEHIKAEISRRVLESTDFYE